MRNMIDLGISSWMADFGEYIPIDAVFYNNTSGQEMYNEYPVLWAKANREAVEESGKPGDIFFVMRAGYSGSQNYTVSMWAGDENVDFSYADGIATTITAALSMGMSGRGLTHFGIGAYTTFEQLGLRRTPDVLLRSAEMAVFTPVMRTHEGNQPSANAQFYSSASMLMLFARLDKLFTMFANYTSAVVAEAAVTGIPSQRALFLHYPMDTQTYSLKYQYLYGRDLLIAPVYLSPHYNRTVFLPSDLWIHLWSEQQYVEPKYIRVPAPLGEPTVFYRKNSTWVDTFKLMGEIRPVIR